MVISYVVRLRPDALADGRFVGEIEAVASGQRSSVRTLDQIAAFILATMPSQVCTASSGRRIAIDGHPAEVGDAPSENLGPDRMPRVHDR